MKEERRDSDSDIGGHSKRSHKIHDDGNIGENSSHRIHDDGNIGENSLLVLIGVADDDIVEYRRRAHIACVTDTMVAD